MSDKLRNLKNLFIQKLSNQEKQAVCCFVLQNDKILGVSRKNNVNDMGLPGGKVDPGETLEEACLRELKEETGLDGKIIQHVYTDFEEDYLVTCFLVEAKGSLHSSEEGIVKWCSPEELIEDSSFANYNRNAIGYLNEIIQDE